MTSDHTIIANKFNTFFANVGFKLAENITDAENTNFRDYLLNQSLQNFTFELISEATTMEMLNNLKHKPSCGYDGISTKLLKTCRLEICKPSTLIIKGMCPKIPLCVICVHSYTNILCILYSYTTPSKFGEKSRHLCILDEGIIRHLPRKCFTYGDATLGC